MISENIAHVVVETTELLVNEGCEAHWDLLKVRVEVVMV